MPKINGNEIRPGNVLEHDGGLWAAVKVDHVKPGKGGAFAQVEMKNLRNGSKLNERFRSSEKVERVRLEQIEYQYLFSDGDMHTFMNAENYEQIALSSEAVGEYAVPYLKDGMNVMIESFEGEPLGVELPQHVTLEVVEADAVVKGQTASSSYKPAVMENGVKVLVPPHIEAGTRIVVDTREGTYVERAKD